MRFITATALAIALAAAAPAAAETEAFVAYGTGTTVCTIEVTKRVYPISIYGGGTIRGQLSLSGSTDCSDAVQQTAHVWMQTSAGASVLDGNYCSGFAKSCHSAASGWPAVSAWATPAQYSVHLTAPLGQGWLGAPTDCSGVGTDNLTCVFTALAAAPLPATTICLSCAIAVSPGSEYRGIR